MSSYLQSDDISKKL